mmetsp:Transcript_38592/g.115856  ORF Transcript_38592/g.115856 Transcript_38592/m.115856 type:complete len:99 (-) Transcript_38592:455-751(-)
MLPDHGDRQRRRIYRGDGVGGPEGAAGVVSDRTESGGPLPLGRNFLAGRLEGCSCAWHWDEGSFLFTKRQRRDSVDLFGALVTEGPGGKVEYVREGLT